MADGDGLSVATPEELTGETKQTQTTPTAPEKGTVPEKFIGKTVEELAASYEELKSEFSKVSEKAKIAEQIEAQLRNQENELGYYRAQQLARQQAQPQAEEPIPVDDFLDEEQARATKRLIQQEMARLGQQTNMGVAHSIAPMAKAQAKVMYPEVFNGVSDAEVENFVNSGVRAGTLAPQVLASPEGWRLAAYIVNGQKNNFKPVATTATTNVPMQPGRVDLPAQTMPAQPSAAKIESEGKFREFYRGIGLSKEQADKLIKEQAEKRGL